MMSTHDTISRRTIASGAGRHKSCQTNQIGAADIPLSGDNMIRLRDMASGLETRPRSATENMGDLPAVASGEGWVLPMWHGASPRTGCLCHHRAPDATDGPETRLRKATLPFPRLPGSPAALWSALLSHETRSYHRHYRPGRFLSGGAAFWPRATRSTGSSAVRRRSTPAASTTCTPTRTSTACGFFCITAISPMRCRW